MERSPVVHGPEEAEEEEEVLVEEREAGPSSQVGPVDQQEMDLEVGGGGIWLVSSASDSINFHDNEWSANVACFVYK